MDETSPSKSGTRRRAATATPVAKPVAKAAPRKAVAKAKPADAVAPMSPVVAAVIVAPTAAVEPATVAPEVIAPAAPVIEDVTPQPPVVKGLMTMNDTVKQVQETAEKMTADATAHVEGFIADASAKTKAAMEKSQAMAEDAMTFHKENAEALVASGKILAAGLQSSSQYVADLGRKNFEETSHAMKTLAGAKSPSEFFALQSDFMKSTYEAAMAESSKATEATMKFFGEMFQPISTRVAVASEKVKTATSL